MTEVHKNTTEHTQHLMQGLMTAVDEALMSLTGKPTGAVLLVFGLDGPTMCNYIANVKREEAISALTSTAARMSGAAPLVGNYLDEKIAGLAAGIKSMQEALPYADGGAYSQDKQRISAMEKELAYWQTVKQRVAVADLIATESVGDTQ